MDARSLKIPFVLILLIFLVNSLIAQSHGINETASQDNGEHDESSEHSACGLNTGEHAEFDLGEVAVHHISDQNIYSIGPWHFPLPCILYAPEAGWDIFSSAKFHTDNHGNGNIAYNRYILFEGSVRRVIDRDFSMGEVEIEEHSVFRLEEENFETGEMEQVIYLCHEDQKWKCDSKSTLDGGLLGGGITSYYDLSITKNVCSMIFVLLFFVWMFGSITRAYKKRDGQAPKGMQSFMEPIFVFIQDDVAKPFLGPKWEQYLPFIMSLFFFILGLNLFGQIPFFGGSNITGNLAVTFVLAIFAFVMTNVNGNRHYWTHIFWMPGIPAWVKTIVTPIEIIGLFIKPLTLMLRLFGNILAGHMVIIIFVGLIFVFGQVGANPGAAWGTSVGSILLNLFMMSIELLVAFIQAFVFAILTASYIGAATEEPHH